MDEYSNREIDTKFDGLHEKLDLIHEQVKYTNGRVRSLEQWKCWLAGGISVLSFLVAALVFPTIIKLIEVWAK